MLRECWIFPSQVTRGLGPPKSLRLDIQTLRENSLHNVLSAAGGLLLRRRGPGERVEQGQLLGVILDPCTGQVQQLLRPDCSSRVFFCRHAQLINGHEVAFRLLPE